MKCITSIPKITEIEVYHTCENYEDINDRMEAYYRIRLFMHDKNVDGVSYVKYSNSRCWRVESTYHAYELNWDAGNGVEKFSVISYGGLYKP